MAICCGSECTITGAPFADATIKGHSFSINLTSNEIDIRNFDSGDYGEYIACNLAGSVSISSYIRPDVTVGDDVTFAATVCGETFSVSCEVTGQDITVDAKGVVEFVTNLRMSGDLTIA